MSVLGTRLDFDEALDKFRSHDIDDDSDARDAFATGGAAGRGVAFHAVCTLGDATVAVVAFPSDDREAERFMYPEDGSLKMSAAIPRVEGTAQPR